MSDKITSSLEIPTDSDGFVSLQCPFCNERFKLTANFINEIDIDELYCPYCGLQHSFENFLTDEVIELAKAKMKNMAMDFISKNVKSLKDSCSNAFFEITIDTDFDTVNEPEVIENDDMYKKPLSCCNFDVKLNENIDSCYCPKCGVYDD
ncbi:TFIIB-type zinc ribbon-containing protein [Clostridium perfringens]|uniref:TFIIB-type zinc ribbon-containing protein n=1 Tax=Clostridium perfringens TaxID=1502 RepID=UPI0032DBCF6F